MRKKIFFILLALFISVFAFSKGAKAYKYTNCGYATDLSGQQTGTNYYGFFQGRCWNDIIYGNSTYDFWAVGSGVHRDVSGNQYEFIAEMPASISSRYYKAILFKPWLGSSYFSGCNNLFGSHMLYSQKGYTMFCNGADISETGTVRLNGSVFGSESISTRCGIRGPKVPVYDVACESCTGSSGGINLPGFQKTCTTEGPGPESNGDVTAYFKPGQVNQIRFNAYRDYNICSKVMDCGYHVSHSEIGGSLFLKLYKSPTVGSFNVYSSASCSGEGKQNNVITWSQSQYATGYRVYEKVGNSLRLLITKSSNQSREYVHYNQSNENKTYVVRAYNTSSSLDKYTTVSTQNCSIKLSLSCQTSCSWSNDQKTNTLTWSNSNKSISNIYDLIRFNLDGSHNKDVAVSLNNVFLKKDTVAISEDYQYRVQAPFPWGGHAVSDRVVCPVCEFNQEFNVGFVASEIDFGEVRDNLEIYPDENATNNPPPGFGDIYAPLWTEVSP